MVFNIKVTLFVQARILGKFQNYKLVYDCPERNSYLMQKQKFLNFLKNKRLILWVIKLRRQIRLITLMGSFFVQVGALIGKKRDFENCQRGLMGNLNET